MYASKLLNSVEKNYTTIERETLTMVYALHKFKRYLLGNRFVFYVDHMALVYLVNKPFSKHPSFQLYNIHLYSLWYRIWSYKKWFCLIHIGKMMNF
jgi:hypothetical protein